MAPHPIPTPVVAAEHLFERDEIVTVFSIIEPPAATATATSKPKPLSIGPIAGGLVGGVAAGLLLTAFVIWFIRYRKKRREEAIAVYERRRRRLAAQRNKNRSRQSTISTAGSGARLNHPPSEKDMNIPVEAPRRPTKSYISAKQPDPFANEKGYGYEPQPLAYVPAGGDYYVQQPYEQPSIQPSPELSTYGGTDGDSHSDTSSTMLNHSTSSSSKSSSRGSHRASQSDKAALTASKHLSERHRPARPSPLANASEKMPDNDYPSFVGSSTSSHEYASAASGAWGIALGDPQYDQTQTQAQGQRRNKSISGQYSADPFEEYHLYESGLGLYDNQIAEGEEDAHVIDFSKQSDSRF